MVTHQLQVERRTGKVRQLQEAGQVQIPEKLGTVCAKRSDRSDHASERLHDVAAACNIYAMSLCQYPDHTSSPFQRIFTRSVFFILPFTRLAILKICTL